MKAEPHAMKAPKHANVKLTRKQNFHASRSQWFTKLTALNKLLSWTPRVKSNARDMSESEARGLCPPSGSNGSVPPCWVTAGQGLAHRGRRCAGCPCEGPLLQQARQADGVTFVSHRFQNIRRKISGQTFPLEALIVRAGGGSKVQGGKNGWNVRR
jgi:hypothetical protein